MFEIEPTLSRLNRINPHFDFPSWCFEPVISEEEIPNYDFWHSLPSVEHKDHTINLLKVKGTGHPSYPSKNWIILLGRLKRCKPCYTYESSLKFFKSGNYSDSDFGFAKYGDIYIINGGNNRTCLAKFIGIETFIAKVTEYFFDTELYELFNWFRNIDTNVEENQKRRDCEFNFTIMSQPVIIDGFQLKKDFISFYENLQRNIFLELKARWFLLKNTIPQKRKVRVKSIEQIEQELVLPIYSHKYIRKV